MALWVTEKRSGVSKKSSWRKALWRLGGGGRAFQLYCTKVYIYICLHIINSKTRSNCKVISSFIIELPSPDVTSIEMNADAYCICSQSLIPNTKDSTLWESSDNYDGTRRLETYRAVAKSKGVAGKLEAMIFLRNLV